MTLDIKTVQAKNPPRFHREAPSKIYLQVCDDSDCDEAFCDHHDVTWCEDRTDPMDVPYVRADLIPAAAPQAAQEPADAYNRKLRQHLEQEWVGLQDLKRAQASDSGEAVATMTLVSGKFANGRELLGHGLPDGVHMLYARPAVKISDEEIERIAKPYYGIYGFNVEAFARKLLDECSIGERRPMTDAEIHNADPLPHVMFDTQRVEFARAIESFHGIGITGKPT